MNHNHLSAAHESRLLTILNREEVEESVADQVSLLGEAASDFVLGVAQGKIKGVSPYQRRNAVFLLGLLKKENAVGGLANVLKEKDAGLRVYAVRALGRVGSLEARHALRQVLEARAATLAEMSYALQSLSSIGGAEDLPAIEAFAKRTTVPLLVDNAGAAISSIRKSAALHQ